MKFIREFFFNTYWTTLFWLGLVAMLTLDDSWKALASGLTLLSGAMMSIEMIVDKRVRQAENTVALLILEAMVNTFKHSNEENEEKENV